MKYVTDLKDYSKVTKALEEMYPKFYIDLEYNGKNETFENIECILFDSETDPKESTTYLIPFKDVSTRLNEHTETNDFTLNMVKNYVKYCFVFQNQMNKVDSGWLFGWEPHSEGILMNGTQKNIKWTFISKLIEDGKITIYPFEDMIKKGFLS